MNDFRLFGSRCSVVRFDWLRTPSGLVFVGLSDFGICNLIFNLSSEDAYRRQLSPWVEEIYRDQAVAETALIELDEYFSGYRKYFSLQVDLRGLKPFAKKVLGVTKRIPFGSRLTYGDIAKKIGSPGASRAVGNALGRNPVPVIVPCHRVVAQGAQLGGFAGGIEIKRALLKLERSQVVNSHHTTG